MERRDPRCLACEVDVVDLLEDERVFVVSEKVRKAPPRDERRAPGHREQEERSQHAGPDGGNRRHRADRVTPPRARGSAAPVSLRALYLHSRSMTDDGDIPVRRGIVIPASELEETASRSSGPGGQHVNKSNTRVTLRWR